jgi:aminoglycoside 6-adenylyltransferase
LFILIIPEKITLSMETISFDREGLLQRIVTWGKAAGDIRALALVGSGAREDHPADQWSDIDLVMITTDPGKYLATLQWVDPIGEIWIPTVERDPLGNVVEQRVLFTNGVDVDFIVLPADRIDWYQHEPLSEIIQAGLRVLVDKDHLLQLAHIAEFKEQKIGPPSLEEFTEQVNDFWFHAVWTAKKLKRGEFWTAKNCCDVYMKSILLKMIAWHECALHGWDKETWYNGRFIESWAGEVVVERLRGVFAHYAEEDIWRALLDTMALFDQIGRETSRRMKFPYPGGEAYDISIWVASLARLN